MKPHFKKWGKIFLEFKARKPDNWFKIKQTTLQDHPFTTILP